MNIEEIEKVQQTLMERIAEARIADAQNYRRELRTSRAALRAINKLLAEMRAE